MSEKTKLLELDLGTDTVIAKSVELKKSIQDAREELDRLKKSEGDNTAEIVKLEASMKKLNSEYNNNQKTLSALVAANGKAVPIQTKVNLLLEEENSTRLKAKQAITELNKIKDELNVNVKEEAELMDKLNRKIDEHTDFLRRTGSEEDKRILNIGRYKEGVTAAIQETGIFDGQLSGLTKVYETGTRVISPFTDAIGENWKSMKNAASGTNEFSGAQKGLAVATNLGTGAMRIFALAVAATGIGLIVIAIALLIGYFRTFDPLVDKIEQGFAAFGAVIRVVQRTIVDFISNLKSVGDLFSKLGKFFSDPIGSLKEMGKEMAEAAKAAAALKEAQQDLADQQAIQSVNNKKQEGEIARLILQSKDRTKSEEERIALLAKAEKINQELFKKNAALADEEYRQAIEAARIKGDLNEQEIAALKKRGVEYAYQLLNLGKITQEEVDLITKAEEAKIDIYNQSTAQQEKIINRQNALIEKAEAEAEERRKKAEERRKKQLSDAAVLAKAELDLFLSQQGVRAKTLAEEVKLAEQVRDKKLKIAQAEFDASEKNKAAELKLLTDQNNAKNEFLEKQNQLVVDNAFRELQAYIDTNQSKIDSQKFFSDFALQEEQRRLDGILQQQLNYERIRFEQGITSETEYQDALKAIRDDYQAKQDEANALRKQAEEEKKTIDLENQRAYEDLVFQDNQAILLARLEQDRLQEVAAAEKTGADIEKINRKYQAAKDKLVREGRVTQVDNTRQAIGEIGQLTTAFFGENKQLAAALASVDMFLAIQKAYLSQLIPGDPTSVGRAILAGAKAGAFGLANVIKVSGVKLATGGKVVGPGTGTSDSIPAMLSNGESVINAKSTSMFGPLLSWINQVGGGKKFASGGMVSDLGISSSLNTVASKSMLIDYDMLAGKIADANRSLPAPQLGLNHFHEANDSYLTAMNGANH
ncbi:hypothetical protein [Flavobacterium sedimenticola]|uniref:Phage tail tape measure protein n=1 Tax=Flavobacterium sedimenticola TaxID=3043286 RepID=A0ABT6XMN0_9FLAO|nr:hypothetical protein [Flavobacterium sedimenticola]MDI9256326.1 hypothetical protein [Flavobacterium sedimenticola]